MGASQMQIIHDTASFQSADRDQVICYQLIMYGAIKENPRFHILSKGPLIHLKVLV